jgi:hypothetical protein
VPDPPEPEGLGALRALDQRHFSAEEIAADNGTESLHVQIRELQSQLEAARAESLNRSIDAVARLPEAPAFDLSEPAVGGAASSFIAAHGEEASRRFANALLAALAPAAAEQPARPAELERPAWPPRRRSRR